MSYDTDDFFSGNDEFEDNSEELELKYFSLGRETRDARLVVFEITKTLDSVEYWLPKSQVQFDLTANTVWVPRWLVENNDLWEYEK